MAGGRLFQTRGPATANALSPSDRLPPQTVVDHMQILCRHSNQDKNYKYNKMIQQDRIIELDREDHITLYIYTFGSLAL